MSDLQALLSFLYGSTEVPRIMARAQSLMDHYRPKIHAGSSTLTEHDAILITYGDQVLMPGEPPLRTLHRFCKQELSGFVNAIHLLPFFPSTSDDGFSVTDYRQVDPALGSWDDISTLSTEFKLMFDAVINHVSAESSWFMAFQRGDPHFRGYFISVAGAPDLSLVVRPRALPLLTSFATDSRERRMWTTFSSDQVDLNYKEPEVLLDVLDVLLMYAERGASFLRLDAVAYLWKEIGTSCIHLPECHAVIQFLRAVLDDVAPHVKLVTETNVPHVDNVSYFGNGTNEAQLVYNFALPPLTLHTLQTGDARVLSEWAATLSLPTEQTTFFNFLASHDGIGLNPARGILPATAIEALVQNTLARGGLISYKDDLDGTQSPYEMNINFFDALSSMDDDEPLEIHVGRFMAAQAIMLALRGVPGVYFHSLFGSRGWPHGVALTGRNRTINREKCDLAALEKELADPLALRSMVFNHYRQLLTARRSSAALDPHGGQTVLDLHPAIFAIERVSRDQKSRVLALHNVGAKAVDLRLPFDPQSDLITGSKLSGRALTVGPYEVTWVKQ